MSGDNEEGGTVKGAIVLAGLVLVGLEPQEIQSARWLAPPSAVDFPHFASFIQVTGEVSVSCRVSVPGPPETCWVVNASASGLGMEEAALIAVEDARIQPRMQDGRPLPTVVTTTIRFHLPERPQTTNPTPSPEKLAIARRLVARRPISALSSDIVALDVSPDRRITINSWIDELVPSREAYKREETAQAMAHLLTLEQMTIMEQGQGAPDQVFVQIDAAGTFETPEYTRLRAELRRRYCAEYVCGDETTAQ